MFLFKASRYLAELKQHRADIYAACEQAMLAVDPDLDFIRVNQQAFLACPSESIDYAVMEKTDSAVVVPLDARWSDVGSWAAVYRMSPRDRNGNVSQSRWLGVDTKNCLIHAPNRLVVLLGVDNTVVVDTPDALLVANLERSQEVREVVDALNREGLTSYTT